VREWNRAAADDILRPFESIPPLEATAGGEVLEVDRRLASDKGGAPAPAPLTELPPLEPEVDLSPTAIAGAAAGDALDRARAAFEGAVAAAPTLQALTDLAVRHRDAEFMTPALREIANARWWALRGENAREGRVRVAVVDLRGSSS
jgi:hypothetical protein